MKFIANITKFIGTPSGIKPEKKSLFKIISILPNSPNNLILKCSHVKIWHKTTHFTDIEEMFHKYYKQGLRITNSQASSSESEKRKTRSATYFQQNNK